MKLHLINTEFASDNIGDQVIMGGIKKNFLEEIISNHEYSEHANHDGLGSETKKIIKDKNPILLLGSNAIPARRIPFVTRNIVNIPTNHIGYFNKNIVSIGCGLERYPDKNNPFLYSFIDKIFNKKAPHSVRDEATRLYLLENGFKNVFNTSCPSIWGVDPEKEYRPSFDSCVISINGYKKSSSDIKALREITTLFNNVYFFPQHKADLDYFKELAAADTSLESILIISRNLQQLLKLMREKSPIHIGNRLHCGLFFIANDLYSFSVNIDNRAMEISKDLNIPSINRDNLFTDSLHDKLTNFKVNLPKETIQTFKEEFNSYFF